VLAARYGPAQRLLVRLLDLRPGEGRLLAPALPFAFSCIGVQSCAVIASDSLFVSAFDLGHLSRFYLVSAVFRVVVSLGYGMLSSRASSARSDAVFVAITGASMLLSWAAVRTGGPALLYAVCVLLVLLPSVLPLVAMNAIMDQLDPRQARRLLPLMGAAATAGAIAMGGMAKLVAPRLGTPSLLLVAAGLCLLAAPLPLAIARRGRTEARGPASKARSLGASALLGFREIGTIDVVRVFAANAVLASLATGLVDFAFKAALKGRYGRDEMAAFLGTFNMVAETAVILAQVFLISRILARLGLRASLASRAGLLLPFAPVLALVPGLAVASTAKFVELTMRLSIGGTVADLLLAPTPPAVRTRAKVVAKAAALPLGSLAAGAVLSLFGASGPSARALALVLCGALVLWLVVLRGAGRAYTSALVAALARGGARLEVTRDTAGLIQHELSGMLSESVKQADVARTNALLALAGDDLLALDDLVPVLAAGGELAATAARAAMRAAKPGDGARLLALIPASDDDELEREVLARARVLGAAPDGPRIERAIARGEAASESPPAASLWAEALACLAAADRDRAVAHLREAAAGSDGSKRASSLAALGELREQSAAGEIERALASDDSAVFAEAARAAVLVELRGAIPKLVSHLSRGTHVRAAARALRLASTAGVSELLAALSTTGGTGGPRSARGVRSIAGAFRIARVLAKLGPDACERTLAVFGELGYHGRNAACRAFAAIPVSDGRRLDRIQVRQAMEITIDYAQTLHGLNAIAGDGLLGREIRHRIADVGDRVLDLAAALADRALVAKARAGLHGGGRARANALELLENVLPRGLRARTIALFERTPAGAADKAREIEPFADEEWLELCRRFDAGEIWYEDPMRPVLEKIVLLHGCTLFGGLSGEELYPVAEIAELVTKSSGETVVRKGDPGDALFVMVDGTVAVVLGGQRAHELGRGAVFGELALLDGEPRSATIEAVTDAELLRIPREQFDALIDESPELARGVIRTLISHVRARG
jgi:hypothetical protein